MKTTILLLAQVAALSAQEVIGADKAATKRVAFAQHCFWTGEMKLGQIDGVVRTEAGFIQGREVTLVEYAPDRLPLEDLVRQARQAGVADAVHLADRSQRPLAGMTIGQPLGSEYRTAPTGDQKMQIQGTPFSRLQLSALQATKVNAFARENPAKALEWLTPIQRKAVTGL